MRVCDDPSVDPAYPVYGGLFREEAIMLLRRFYVQENEKGEFDSFHRSLLVLRVVVMTEDVLADLQSAPEPKQKKNRELKTDIIPVQMAVPSPTILGSRKT